MAYASGMMFPLTTYIEAGLEMARYDKLEDGSFAGEIPKLKGVIAFGKSLRECENELRSALEDWILVGLRLGHKLPVVVLSAVRVSPGRLAEFRPLAYLPKPFPIEALLRLAAEAVSRRNGSGDTLDVENPVSNEEELHA